MEAARTRQANLTKPAGALGRLEALSIQLAGITGQLWPALTPRQIIVCAADHGVTAEGVSAYPSAVTAQMVLNFLHGGAAINVLARQFGATVLVLDVGVQSDLPTHPQLRAAKVRRGTGNLRREPAMQPLEAVAAVEAGIGAAQAAIAEGARVLVTGDMGIGNTTASAAIAAVMTGEPPAAVTGFGTGLDDAGRRHKAAVIQEALALHRPNPHDGLDVLAKVGGLEIGAIAGVILAGAAACAGRHRRHHLDGGRRHRRQSVFCRAALLACRPPRRRTRACGAAVISWPGAADRVGFTAGRGHGGRPGAAAARRRRGSAQRNGHLCRGPSLGPRARIVIQCSHVRSALAFQPFIKFHDYKTVIS